jgi:hypothetical protein
LIAVLFLFRFVFAHAPALRLPRALGQMRALPMYAGLSAEEQLKVSFFLTLFPDHITQPIEIRGDSQPEPAKSSSCQPTSINHHFQS